MSNDKQEQQQTVVIVGGPYLTAAHYEPFAAQLREQGYKVVIPEQPVDREPSDNAAAIGSTIESLADAGEEILVIAHSMGGVAGSNALKGKSVKERSEAGKPGGVVGIVYLAGYMLGEGETPATHADKNAKLVDSSGIETAPDGSSTQVAKPVAVMFHDVQVEHVERHVQALVPHKHSATVYTVDYEAWRDIEVTYIVTEDDQVVAMEVQEHMIEVVKAQGVDVKVVRLKSGHNPFLSMPHEVAKVVHKAAKPLHHK